MAQPSQEWLLESDPVWRNADDSWRHGSYVTEVYKAEDGSFWRVNYRRQTNGEYNELRDGGYTIEEVEPYERTVTEYRKKR